MESPVTVREEPAQTVVFVRRQGAFAHIPEAMQTLLTHLQDNGLTPHGPPVGVFYDDPRTVPEAEARWEVYWAVAEPQPERAPEGAPGGDAVGVRHIAARQLATVLHTGPYDQVGPAYARAVSWLGDRGYTIVGPSEEAYLSGPDTPPETIKTEIRFPVAKAPISYAT